jgi:hypothetical protein
VLLKDILNTHYASRHAVVDRALSLIQSMTSALLPLPPGPSGGIAAVTAAVRQDPQLANANDGKHWCEQWERAELWHVLQLGGDTVATLLARPDNPRHAATSAFVQQLFEAALQSGDVGQFQALARTVLSGRQGYNVIQERCVPLLRRAVARVEALRTEAWQRDSCRTPARLPDVFAVELLILQTHGLTEDSPREDVARFAGDVKAAIEKLAAGDARTPYHEPWDRLKTAVVDKLSRSHQVAVAVLLGTLTTAGLSAPTLANYLMVELANRLLQTGHTPSSLEVLEEAKQMLQCWEESSVEAFREEAHDTLASSQLFGRDQKAKEDKWAKNLEVIFW